MSLQPDHATAHEGIGMGRANGPQSQYSEIRIEEVRLRAAKPLAAKPRPFLRWAGSKRALLGNVVDLLPGRFRVYREPFLGSGSLFLGEALGAVWVGVVAHPPAQVDTGKAHGSLIRALNEHPD